MDKSGILAEFKFLEGTYRETISHSFTLIKYYTGIVFVVLGALASNKIEDLYLNCIIFLLIIGGRLVVILLNKIYNRRINCIDKLNLLRTILLKDLPSNLFIRYKGMYGETGGLRKSITYWLPIVYVYSIVFLLMIIFCCRL